VASEYRLERFHDHLGGFYFFYDFFDDLRGAFVVATVLGDDQRGFHGGGERFFVGLCWLFIALKWLQSLCPTFFLLLLHFALLPLSLAFNYI
jgi:hypothetical protein